MPLVIRSATPEDAVAIQTLIVELAIYEKEPDKVETSADILASQLGSARPPFECLLAEVGDKIVGFAIFFPNYSTWRGRPGIWLEDLYVRPAFRHYGVGRALLCRIGALAIERGCGRVEWPVLDWNTPAHHFYEGVGARKMEEWTTWRVEGEGIGRLAGICP